MSSLKKARRVDRGLAQHEPTALVGFRRLQTLPDCARGLVRPRLRQQLAQRRYPHHV